MFLKSLFILKKIVITVLKSIEFSQENLSQGF